jgi:hypothetical protein
MDTLDQRDRKRRRVKPKGQLAWAKALVRPKTLKALLTLGPAIAKAFYWIFKIIEVLRN